MLNGLGFTNQRVALHIFRARGLQFLKLQLTENDGF